MITEVQVDVSEAADGFEYAPTWHGKMQQLINGVIDFDDWGIALLCAQQADQATERAAEMLAKATGHEIITFLAFTGVNYHVVPIHDAECEWAPGIEVLSLIPSWSRIMPHLLRVLEQDQNPDEPAAKMIEWCGLVADCMAAEEATSPAGAQ